MHSINRDYATHTIQPPPRSPEVRPVPATKRKRRDHRAKGPPSKPRAYNGGCVEWFWMDNVLIDEHADEIGAHGIAMYCVLARHADRYGNSFPGIPYLASKLKCSERKAQQVLNDLVTRGLVWRVERFAKNGAQLSNSYGLIEINAWLREHPPAGDAPHPPQEMHPKNTYKKPYPSQVSTDGLATPDFHEGEDEETPYSSSPSPQKGGGGVGTDHEEEVEEAHRLIADLFALEKKPVTTATPIRSTTSLVPYRRDDPARVHAAFEIATRIYDDLVERDDHGLTARHFRRLGDEFLALHERGVPPEDLEGAHWQVIEIYGTYNEITAQVALGWAKYEQEMEKRIERVV